MNAYRGLNVYWGDLHCHVREWRRDRFSSGKPGADGPWRLDDVYAFGREDAGAPSYRGTGSKFAETNWATARDVWKGTEP